MKRAGIDSAPRVVRDLLDQEIRLRGFAYYDEIAEKFKRFGKGFSHSSIHRYAQKLQEREQRAQVEAEIIVALGDTVGWLVQWARRYPKQAERLVLRLQTQQPHAP